jgi:TolB-like protein/class 3 adenylate cyclase
MAPRLERKLAAILAADVVGYSRLVGEDEAGTIARVKTLRQEFIEPLVAEYHGRVVRLMGDGTLVEFASAVDAVECAVAIQNGVAEREAAVPEDRRIVFRIGLNVGDIIVQDGDILGDGVNVAARLEGLAKPGGICIARNVWNQVKAKLDLGFEAMGEHRVKNIAERIAVYRVLSGLDATPPAAAADIFGSRAAEAKPPPPLPDKPLIAIAVLPFDNISGEERDARLADGITEDIITDLSRFRDLFIIARNSTKVYKNKAVDVREVGRDLGVQYVLEGSLQTDGKRVRVSAQLVDGTTGGHVWSERYDRDRPLSDIFAIQDEVTGMIAASLAGQSGVVARIGREIARRKPPANLQAYDHYLLGLAANHILTNDGYKKAQRHFKKAIALDPHFARAYVGLAWSHNHAYDNAWSHSRQETLTNWLEASKRAVALDSADGEAHMTLGWYYQYTGDLDRARGEIEQAIRLSPNNADVLVQASAVWAWLGEPEKAVEAAERAMRLNPLVPDWYYGPARDAYFHARYFREASIVVEKRQNRTIWDLVYRPLIYAQLGCDKKVAVARAELLQCAPDYSAEKFLSDSGSYARDVELNLFLDSHRKAVLPICATEAQLAQYPEMKRLEQCEAERIESRAGAAVPRDYAVANPIP